MNDLYLNKTVDINGKFTKTIGGYILSLKDLNKKGFLIDKVNIKTKDDMYKIIDKANNTK